jgi:hypothetical protein
MYFKHTYKGIGIDTGPAHVRFLVYKIALTHYLFQELRFFLIQNHATSYSCFTYLPTTLYSLTTREPSATQRLVLHY